MKKNLKILLLFVMIFGLLLTGCDEKEEEKAKYRVTFDSNGGSEVFTQEVEEGSLAQKPEDPTRDGYIFGGWEYNDEEYTFNESVSKDITLKAKWTQSVVRYSVKFDSDGGTTVYTITVNEGEVAKKPTDPTREGYTFKYWTLNDAEYTFDAPVTSNIELKAVWVSASASTSTHTVTFDSSEGSEVASQTVKHNGKATAPKNPTRSGYVFLDWTLNGNIFKFTTKITADITLVATWAKEGNYTITFDTNGSPDTIPKQTVKAGKLVTRPTDPTKEGYVLKEWQFNNQTFDFSTKVSQDMILKAIWELPKFKVTFNSNGGTTVKAQNVEINKKATKPTNPTKTGHTFLGWFIGEGDSATEYDFNTPVTEAITLNAKWEANKYTVTFNSNGGSEVASQEVTYGNKAQEPSPAPTREGYVFKGWLLNNKPYAFSTKVTKSITLVASWTKESEKTYTFNYESIEQAQIDNGGVSGTNDVTIRVYENNVQINFSSIRVDDYELCKGVNPTVNLFDIKGKTSVTVILTNGKSVTATYKK